MPTFRPIPTGLVALAAALPLAAAPPAQEDWTAVEELFKPFDRPDAPGVSVGVIRDGKIAFAKGYGLADVEAKLPAGPGAYYRLASVSKQFTAMCVLILKERGKLSLDDPLTKLFPGFPAYGKEIRVRNLLRHTSGLIDYEDVIPADMKGQLLDKDVLSILKGQDRLYFPAGTQFKYSNSGYALLALIVEAASGKRYADFLREAVFAPLGMDGAVAHEKGVSEVARRAYGYTEKDGKFERTDQSQTSAVLGDGGIYCSIEDYAKWDAALYTEKLVHRATLEEAFTAGKLTDGAPTRYGYGWFTDEMHGTKRLYHNGGTIGFNHAVTRLPEKKLTVIVLMNRDGEGQSRKLCDQVVELMVK